MCTRELAYVCVCACALSHLICIFCGNHEWYWFEIRVVVWAKMRFIIKRIVYIEVQRHMILHHNTETHFSSSCATHNAHTNSRSPIFLKPSNGCRFATFTQWYRYSWLFYWIDRYSFSPLFYHLYYIHRLLLLLLFYISFFFSSLFLVLFSASLFISIEHFACSAYSLAIRIAFTCYKSG